MKLNEGRGKSLPRKNPSIFNVDGSDNKYLPGIYNYCDRWCERCSYTDKCLTFSMNQEFEIEDKDGNDTFDDTIDSIFKMFEEMIEFLKNEASKRGIDLSEEVDLSDYQNAKEKAESHPLSIKSYKYFQHVREWFRSREGLMAQKGDEIIQLAELGLNEEKIENNLRLFVDSFETIKWYFAMIHVKIVRALQTKFESTMENSEFKFEQVNTSAKIALIGCEKSLKAWQILYVQFSEDEDKILSILSYLDILRKEIILEFPDVTTFTRPYFD